VECDAEENAKDIQEIKIIASIFKNKFNEIDDGSYFMWRPEVINTIHTANLSVLRKYMFITKFLERSKASHHVHLHDVHSKHVRGPDSGIRAHVQRSQSLFRFCENKVDQWQQIKVE
jgi:hypothetical protein